MVRVFLLSAFVGLLSVNGFADVVTLFVDDEPGLGEDLSNDSMNPTQLGVLPVGQSQVLGVLFNVESDNDPDIFTFNVAPNQTLDSITVSIEGDRHFFGLDAGPTSVDPNTGNGSDLLIAALIGGNTGNLLIPGNIDIDYGGSGVTTPLGPGDYTIWIQETAVDDLYPYTVTFETSVAAVPEPSSLALFCIAGAVVGCRRRRRKPLV
ncbi:PEP-CTERM sorting domain-containing protein [Stieleria sp. TO1_6]|uniref:PEP-CTERM sorting domain-containing protein n=1 Tax=Stieleria tagensis TaxID=2956795 RepID=UPI00209A944B|nr:PEP-CTERM sorting domain-containing protein [Stieleria tagensis]MCO8121189.1 PEP-CTERM sorting domain-containing protein [Stieleria tagensis]